MLRIAVCDDNLVICDQICEYLSDIFNARQIEFEISKYAKGSLLLHANDNENFDIIFLDIQMPEINGFDIANEIKKKYPRINIIFVTSNNELVYKTFDYQPFYFICKGTSEKLKTDIIKSVELLFERIKQYATILLELPLLEKKLVPVREILYIESMGHYLTYYTETMGLIKVRSTIENAILEMEQYDFTRVHRRFLVNLAHVHEISLSETSIKISDGTILTTGGKYQDQVYDKYIKYMRIFDY